MLELLPASDYREQPWKNGGGLTHEIAVALSDDERTVLWRISLATIDRDGPFSDFRGYDRTIVAIEGDPVELTTGGETVILRCGEPHSFAGEAKSLARLTGTRARDLNVMTLRAAFSHDVEIVREQQRFVLDDDEEFALVYAIDGASAVGGLACAAGDAVAIEEVDSFDVITTGVAAVIRITPL
jgi:environmental stress-induced protein Ves